MTTMDELYGELMGTTKTKPGEDAFALTPQQTIDGLRLLVKKRERERDSMVQQHNHLVDQAAQLTELRGVLKAILADDEE